MEAHFVLEHPYFSSCRGELKKSSNVWHCWICGECQDWREWHCKGCNKYKFRMSVPYSTCSSEIYKKLRTSECRYWHNGIKMRNRLIPCSCHGWGNPRSFYQALTSILIEITEALLACSGWISMRCFQFITVAHGRWKIIKSWRTSLMQEKLV
jgi:hypothetical protein